MNKNWLILVFLMVFVQYSAAASANFSYPSSASMNQSGLYSNNSHPYLNGSYSSSFSSVQTSTKIRSNIYSNDNSNNFKYLNNFSSSNSAKSQTNKQINNNPNGNRFF